MPLFADGPTAPPDQGVAVLLFAATLLLGWVAFMRLRGRAFGLLPRWAGWASAGLAGISLALAITLPLAIRPVPRGRLSTTARVAILSPTPGRVFTGNPADVPVRLRLSGGEIVPFTSTKVTRDQGHIHLFLDGALVSMTTSLGTVLQPAPGQHVLRAEFVAADHAPFSPREVASVTFRVESG
jgi:hypothetical protein